MARKKKKSLSTKVLVTVVLILLVVFSLFLNSVVSTKDIIKEDNNYTISKDSNPSTNVVLDKTQQDKGYVYCHIPANSQLQVMYDDKLIAIYPIMPSVQDIKVRFTKLNGDYTFNVINNGERVYTETIKVEDLNPSVLTASSYMVNYDKTQYLSDVPTDSIEYNYSDYAYNNIKYSKKDLIEENYVPNLDVIALRKSGVCTDIAAYAGALYGIHNIPYINVYGYRDGDYHAWLKIYKDGNWVQVDPTFNNTNAKYEELYEY